VRLALPVALAALALAPAAVGGGFAVGIVNPTPVPPAESAELGTTLQRYDLEWRGEPAFDGSLVVSPATEPVVALWPEDEVYAAATAPAFCAWAASVLDRFPRIRRVIVGNEPPPGNPVGYAAVAAACAPLLHARGAFVLGPGMVPAGSYVQQRFLDAVRAGGARLDAWDVHPYWFSGLAWDRDVVARVRATLGPRVQTWITEDGVQSIYPGWNQWYSVGEAEQARVVASDVMSARCAGVAAWFNFLLVDQDFAGGWQSGLVRSPLVGGGRKPAWDALAAAARSSWCPSAAKPPASPPPLRRAFRSRWRVAWRCPEPAPGAKRRPPDRRICLPERVRNR